MPDWMCKLLGHVVQVPLRGWHLLQGSVGACASSLLLPCCMAEPVPVLRASTALPLAPDAAACMETISGACLSLLWGTLSCHAHIYSISWGHRWRMQFDLG